MKTLIIYGHPKSKGHCATILSEVEKRLKEKSISYEVIDLYKEGFDPVLKKEEHFGRPSGDVKKYQSKIAKAYRLIFIYPNWWGTMPAMVKGFIERVFSSDFAFRYEGQVPKGLLKGKKALVFITAGGPRIYSIVTGDRAANLIKSDILRFCGIKSGVFQLGNALNIERNKERIAKMVKKAIDGFYR